jgi:hypothetical protein
MLFSPAVFAYRSGPLVELHKGHLGRFDGVTRFSIALNVVYLAKGYNLLCLMEFNQLRSEWCQLLFFCPPTKSCDKIGPIHNMGGGDVCIGYPRENLESGICGVHIFGQNPKGHNAGSL